MNLKYIRAFIVLVAALITVVYSIYARINVTDMLIILLIVLIVFYVIGSIVINIIRDINNKARAAAIEAEKKRVEEERKAKISNAEKNIEEDIDN